MELEERVKELQALVTAMSEQQNIMAAELVGMKKALSVMAAFLPMTQDDVTDAWETAIDQVGNAIESGGTPPDMQPAELEMIRQLLALAGAVWRDRTQAQ